MHSFVHSFIRCFPQCLLHWLVGSLFHSFLELLVWVSWYAALLQFLLLVASPWPFPGWAEAIQGALLGLFMMEQLAKLLALPSWKLRSTPKRFDLLAVLCLLAAALLPAFRYGP